MVIGRPPLDSGELDQRPALTESGVQVVPEVDHVLAEPLAWP
jgi:hypothetical protein